MRTEPEHPNRPDAWERVEAVGIDAKLSGCDVTRARWSVVTMQQYRDAYGLSGPHGTYPAQGGDWHGGLSTRDDVFNMLSGRGDRAQALVERIHRLSDEVSKDLPPLPSRRRRKVWSDDGSDYDFDRLQDFHDRPAASRKRTVRTDPGTVHLVLTFGGSSGTSDEALSWAGAPGLAVARALLDQGYSVSIDACFATTDLRRAQGIVVRLLESGTSFDTDDAALAGVVCSAGTFRTCGFTVHALNEPRINEGLGYCKINPARVYQASAKAGFLPVPTWCFEPSFNRTEALKSAREALRAIVAQLDPGSVLSTEGSHDAAMRQGGGW